MDGSTGDSAMERFRVSKIIDFSKVEKSEKSDD